MPEGRMPRFRLGDPEEGQLKVPQEEMTVYEYYKGVKQIPFRFAKDARWPAKNQLVGIELEYENATHLPNRDQLIFWTYDNDGSLRAHVGGKGAPVEFKFRAPLAGKNLTEALNEMRLLLKTTKVCCTDRTSVHVHLDVSRFNAVQLQRLFLQYAIVEGLLFNYCGNPTKFYCTPWARHEDMCPDVFQVSGMRDMMHRISNGGYKYGGLNATSVRKKRRVEIRMHPGCSDMDLIERWVKILMRVVVSSETVPMDMAQLSAFGFKKYAEESFGEYFRYLDCPDLEDLMILGARLAQHYLLSDVIRKESEALINATFKTRRNT